MLTIYLGERVEIKIKKRAESDWQANQEWVGRDTNLYVSDGIK